MQTEAPVTGPRAVTDTGVALNGVSKRHSSRRGQVQALDGLDLRARAGEVLAVVGPSGCGKSTLLELVAGLAEPNSGRITAAGATRARDRLARCAYMPQRDLLLPWRSALDNAALALECAGASRAEARRRAVPLFERFGLRAFAHALPAELSGGMRQRVAFLRTLLADRAVLLLDEPFAALDSITRASMQEWLASALEGEPRTVILVTHDVEEALLLGDRLAVLSPRPGRVVAELDVALARPRPRRATLLAQPDFGALRERALEALGS